MVDFYSPGSFRGVAFEYIEDDYARRKKEADHNYLDASVATEPTGNLPRTYSLKFCVLGKNAVVQRNKLIKALDEDGPGILEHPQYGRLSVKLTDDGYSVHGSYDKGNYFEFDAEFTLADADKMRLSVMPVAADVTEILAAADLDVQLAVMADFVENFKTQGFLDFVAENVAALASEIMDKINALMNIELLPFATIAKIKGSIGTIFGSMGRLLSYPEKLANEIANMLNTDGLTYDFFKRLSALSFSIGTPKYQTASRRQSVKNQQAIVSLVSLISSGKAIASASVLSVSSETAIIARIEEITKLAESVTDDEETPAAVKQSFEALLQASVAVLKEQAQVSSMTVTPAQTVPAVVLLHSRGGVAVMEKNTDFAERNNIKNPLFTLGGKPVEVING